MLFSLAQRASTEATGRLTHSETGTQGETKKTKENNNNTQTRDKHNTATQTAMSDDELELEPYEVTYEGDENKKSWINPKRDGKARGQNTTNQRHTRTHMRTGALERGFCDIMSFRLIVPVGSISDFVCVVPLSDPGFPSSLLPRCSHLS